jgi:hypothetical protein
VLWISRMLSATVTFTLLFSVKINPGIVWQNSALSLSSQSLPSHNSRSRRYITFTFEKKRGFHNVRHWLQLTTSMFACAHNLEYFGWCAYSMTMAYVWGSYGVQFWMLPFQVSVLSLTAILRHYVLPTALLNNTNTTVSTGISACSLHFAKYRRHVVNYFNEKSGRFSWSISYVPMYRFLSAAFLE